MRIRSTIISFFIVMMIAPPLIGCSHDPIMPGSAKIVGSGQGRFGYVADENGTSYLRDWVTKEIIASFHVARGDMVNVDPQRNQIEEAGSLVDHKKTMDPDHNMELYFDRA